MQWFVPDYGCGNGVKHLLRNTICWCWCSVQSLYTFCLQPARRQRCQTFALAAKRWPWSLGVVCLSWSLQAADVINSTAFVEWVWLKCSCSVRELCQWRLFNKPRVCFFLFLCRKQKYGNKGKASVFERFPQGHPQTFPRQKPGDTAWGWGRREATPAGEVGKQDWLSAVRGWWIYWFRQCLAVSVSLLQKWRRWVFLYFVLRNQSVCLKLAVFSVPSSNF